MAEKTGIDGEIMAGVYEALCQNGYADLTMQDISDACDKSTSLLHYHYNTKEDLLVAFLDQLLSEYQQYTQSRTDLPPVDRLIEFIGWYVILPSETDRTSYHAALLEFRSQGPYNDRIRQRLQSSDTLQRKTAAEILHHGIDEGVFHPIDVDQTAALLVATLDGARTRQLTLGDSFSNTFYTKLVAEAVLERLIQPLLTENAPTPDFDVASANVPVQIGDTNSTVGEEL